MGCALRPYQREAIDAVRRDWRDGHRAVLGTAATGLGKTQIMLGLITEELAAGGRALILSHRQELVFQPLQRLAEFWPEWKRRAGAVMAEYDECDRTIVSATVQTLCSEKRLERLLWAGPITHLVIDEAHHSIADSYVAVYERLLQANPRMLALGLTATPIRADGKGLRQIFSRESFHYDIRWAIQHGWLVPPRWLAISTGISLAGVQVRAGDFIGKQLADVFETANCFDLVTETHRKYADGRQAIAFTESVDGAYRLAEAFRRAGIRAEAADGTTNKEDRARLLEGYRAGQLDVLCNAQLFTEGVDLPACSCLHMVRPTRSDGAYIQMVGRGLRLAPGKEDCLILDYCPAEARNICMLGDVLGVEVRKEAYVDENAPIGEVAGGFTFDSRGVKWLRGDPAEIISRELDYLEISPFSWHKSADHWLTLGLGEGADGLERTLAITPPDAQGRHSLWLICKDRERRREDAEVVADGAFEQISDQAEEIIGRWASQVLVRKQRQWRRQPASDSQRHFALSLGCWQEGISKGECAERITHALAMRAVRRATRARVPAM